MMKCPCSHSKLMVLYITYPLPPPHTHTQTLLTQTHPHPLPHPLLHTHTHTHSHTHTHTHHTHARTHAHTHTHTHTHYSLKQYWYIDCSRVYQVRPNLVGLACVKSFTKYIHMQQYTLRDYHVHVLICTYVCAHCTYCTRGIGVLMYRIVCICVSVHVHECTCI